MIDAVIFDLDGTLVDLPINYEKLFEEFKEILRTDTVRPLVDVVSKVDEPTRENLFKAWEKAELAILNQVSAKETGSKIYNEYLDKRKALITLQGRNTTFTILKNFNLSFEVILTREDTLLRTDQLSRAIQQLGVNECKVLFVGNTEGDAKAASQIGCQFLRV